MKRKLLLTILACSIVFSGCGAKQEPAGDTTKEQVEDTEAEKTEDIETDTETDMEADVDMDTEEPESEEISATKKEFYEENGYSVTDDGSIIYYDGGPVAESLSNVVVVDGKDYNVPCTLNDFTEAGWTVDEENSELSVEANDRTTISLNKDEFELQVVVDNSSDTTEDAFSLPVIGIASVFDSDIVKLSSGITIGSTRDEVISALGNPTSAMLSFGENETVSYYKNEDFLGGKVSITFENDIVCEFDIEF